MIDLGRRAGSGAGDFNFKGKRIDLTEKVRLLVLEKPVAGYP